MTDREKLIELLGEDTCKHSGCYDCEYDCDRDACVSFLKNSMADYLIANGVTFRKWIPITERLPKHSEIVLCRLTFNELRILQWDSISKWWLGYGTGDDWRQKNVTHWMPLPEPPKENDNEM